MAGRFLSIKEREITEDYLQSDGTVKAEREIMKVHTGKSKPLPKRVKQKINDIMDDCGLSDERLVKKLKTKLNAKKEIVVQSRSQTVVKKIQDHNAQLKALDMAFKIKGHMDSNKQGDGTTKLVITSGDGNDIEEKRRKLTNPNEEDINQN
jgi:hypothetical protein